MSNETKKCPFCAEEINAEAIKCRFCGEMLTQNERDDSAHDTEKNKGDYAEEMEKKVKDVAGKAMNKADELYNRPPLDGVNEKLKKLPIKIDVRSRTFKVILSGIIVLMLGIASWCFFSESSVDGMVKELVVEVLEKNRYKLQQQRSQRNPFHRTDLTNATYRCSKITNVESIGKNQYSAKAMITANEETGTVDIMYEKIDDIVQVYVELDSITWIK